MTLTRRRALGLAAALVLPTRVLAAPAVEIAMWGDASGAHVGFDPAGLLLAPGQTVRWTNGDRGNSHTATAYHPANSGRPRRMPRGSEPWDSDYLLPGENFEVTLTAEGVYDYYCVPHEHAGMVGRIIVGDPGADRWMEDASAAAGLPEVALAGFPPVAEIVARGVVRRA